ncbi:MAG: hypothetical protein ABIR96_01605 [Bdellovibrionota bacterium]
MMKKPEITAEIQRLLSEASAADAADLFISPHISEELLFAATYEPGPAMWIVNRSDVFDETLAHLVSHPDRGIARRAGEKLQARRAPSVLLAEPEDRDPRSASEVPDFEVEEVLGHPRVALSSVMHFTYALKAEHRASAALSATRRILEYPPEWSSSDISRERLVDRISQMLVDDPSPLVRSYATRFPLLDAAVIAQGLSSEKNPTVKARLLQHPHSPLPSLLNVAEASLGGTDDAFVDIVVSLDARLPRDLRAKLLASDGTQRLPYLAELCHLYQI